MRDRPDVFRARQADHLRGLQRWGDPQQLLHALQQLTSAARLSGWRYKTRKDADGDGKDVGDAFRVTAFFFGLHQVEPV